MTNLEWINGQIEIMNRKIKFLNNEVNHNGIIDPLEPNLTAEEIQMVLSHATQTLQILTQIKNELEAWEVVKQYCDYQDGDPFDCIPEGFYLIKPIKGKDFLIVRKALEEKDVD